MDWPVDIGLGKSVIVVIPVAKRTKAIKAEHKIEMESYAPPKSREIQKIHVLMTCRELGEEPDAKKQKKN